MGAADSESFGGEAEPAGDTSLQAEGTVVDMTQIKKRDEHSLVRVGQNERKKKKVKGKNTEPLHGSTKAVTAGLILYKTSR